MPFSIEITGIQQLVAYAQYLAANLKPLTILRLTEIFEAGMQRMQKDCPVRTGNLKRSISLNKSSSGSTILQINITARYAGFVAFGTRHQRANPFFSNAYNFILSEIKRISLA